VGKVLPGVIVPGSFPAPDDVFAPFDARGFVLVHGVTSLLGETRALEEVAKVQDLVAAVDAEWYSASAVERAVVFCIFKFERQRTGDVLYKHRLPCFPSRSLRTQISHRQPRSTRGT
jgi:hypothetical protein